MKFRIHKDIAKFKLKDLVPTAYRGLAEGLDGVIEGEVTLVIFPHNRKDVVKSSVVQKALAKIRIDTVNNLVVVGGCFSLESVDILKKHEAHFLSLSEFPWTDSRYSEIKQGKPKSIDKP